MIDGVRREKPYTPCNYLGAWSVTATRDSYSSVSVATSNGTGAPRSGVLPTGNGRTRFATAGWCSNFVLQDFLRKAFNTNNFNNGLWSQGNLVVFHWRSAYGANNNDMGITAW